MDAAVSKALRFIASAQRKDGSFSSHSSPTLAPFVANKTYTTTFIQALILSALSPVAGKQALAIRGPLAAWLLEQKSPVWSFNYWPRSSEFAQQMPYPDDLDDTFCALIALHAHDSSLVDAAALSKIVKLLVAAETEPGGPYRTWLTPSDSAPAWQDVDLAVNANIAGFLRLVAGSLPNITGLIETAIINRRLASPYYPSPYPIVYYLSRAYSGPAKESLAAELLLLAKRGTWQTPLQTALAVSSLVQLGRVNACPAGVAHLQATQQLDGSWPAEAFCLDPAQQKQTYYNGAASLTTAFALEALSRYESALKPSRSERAAKPNHYWQSLNSRIYSTVEAELSELYGPQGGAYLNMMDAIKQSDDDHEITLLPAFFATSLKAPLAPIAEHTLISLGEANLYGWIAYTIYDDFLDETGNVCLLSTANVALRRSLATFRASLPDSQKFHAIVETTFDTIDAANTWEVTHCRFVVADGQIAVRRLPRYGRRIKLAERSLGHLLTPLAILATAQKPVAKRVERAIKRGFTHYLIARQLSDDLHDWEQDIRHGHISYVVAETLRDSRIPPGAYSLEQLIPRLERQFWHHTILRLCDIVAGHIKQARQAFASSSLLTDHNDLLRMLDRIDQVVAKTRREQADAEAFLTAYKNG